MGIMMKLYDRERTGSGGYVHTSLLEAQVFMLDFQASRYLMDGEVAGQAGNDHPVEHPDGRLPDHRQADQHRGVLAQALDQFLQGRRP